MDFPWLSPFSELYHKWFHWQYWRNSAAQYQKSWLTAKRRSDSHCVRSTVHCCILIYRTTGLHVHCCSFLGNPHGIVTRRVRIYPPSGCAHITFLSHENDTIIYNNFNNSWTRFSVQLQLVLSSKCFSLWGNSTHIYNHNINTLSQHKYSTGCIAWLVYSDSKFKNILPISNEA